MSWSPLSLWCSPGYSSITQSTVHDWLRERGRERRRDREKVSARQKERESMEEVRGGGRPMQALRVFHSIAFGQMDRVMNAAVG